METCVDMTSLGGENSNLFFEQMFMHDAADDDSQDMWAEKFEGKYGAAPEPWQEPYVGFFRMPVMDADGNNIGDATG